MFTKSSFHWKKLLLGAALSLGVMTHAAAQNWAIATHLNYVGAHSNSDIIMNKVMVPVTTAYNYNEVLGWHNLDGSGGYAGIQDQGGGVKNFIFSIWNSADPMHQEPITAAYAGPGTIVSRFSGEGEGLGSNNFDLGWSVNNWYNLVSRVWSVGDHTHYGFWAQDLTTNKWTHLVTMDYPVAKQYFNYGNDAFLEDWAQNGASARKVLYKDAWQRSDNKVWGLQKTVNFLANEPTGNYANNFNAGVENGAFFMQTGGTTTPAFSGRAASFSITSTATSPTLATGEITSYAVTYKADERTANAAWSVNELKSPQYAYTFEIFNNASFTGTALASRIDTTPQARTAALYIPTLANGTYYTRIKIRDIFDKVSTVKTSTLTIASDNPVVNISVPANSAQLIDPASVAISANATDPNGITKVEFFVNGSKIGEDLTVPYSFDWTNLSKADYRPTTYKLTAVATDNTGKTGKSQETLVTVIYQAVPVNPTNTQSGVDYKYYEGQWWTVPDFSTLTPVKSGTTDNFDTTPKNRDKFYAINFTGYITVPADGLYRFFTDSDAASNLYIGNSFVVHNDTVHRPVTKSGQIALKAGTHAIRVDYLQYDFPNVLKVYYTGPGIGKTLIPNAVLSRQSSGTGNCSDPAWNAATAYNGGAKVSFNNNIYTAKWWTQNNQPDLNTGDGKAWALTGPCGNTPACADTWLAATAYQGGASVYRLGKHYVAAYWSQGAAPESHAGPYQEWVFQANCQAPRLAAEKAANSVSAFPNPFVADAKVVVELATADEIVIDVFNIYGVRVATVFSGAIEAGTHHLALSSPNLSAGVYIIRVSGHTITEKITIIKN